MKPETHTAVKNGLRRFAVKSGLPGIIRYCLPTLVLSALFRPRAFARPRTSQTDPPVPHSIVVFRLDRIGDVVLSSAMLRELRNLYPAAHITIVVSNRTGSLVEHCPYVDEVLDVQTGPDSFGSLLSSLQTTLAFSKAKLGGRAWDLAIVPRWDADIHFAAMMCAYTRATRRIGFSEKTSRTKRRLNWGFDALYTDVLPPGQLKHEAERNLDIVRYLGGDVSNTDLELWLTPADFTYAEQCRADFGLTESDMAIAFGIGASGGRKRWPAASFARLINRLQRTVSFTPAIIFGPDEASLAHDVQALAGAKLLLLERPSLRQAAALLSRCALFIGNDSGPMHLAAAAGIPVVDICCHPVDGCPDHDNSPERFGPLTNHRSIVRPTHARTPCKDFCASFEPHCIADITVEQVAAEAQALLRAQLPLVRRA